VSIESELKDIGLKDNEVRVFLAVLELGETTIGEVEKQVSLHRQLIYNATDSLHSDGLIRIREIRGKKHFSVPNPKVIEERAKERLERVKSIVPKLVDRANSKQAKDEVSIYRGERAVRNYYVESIGKEPKGVEILILGVNSERYFALFPVEDKAYQKFETQRVKRRIGIKLILFGEKEKEVELNKNREYFKLRLLEDLVEAPNDIVVWKEKVSMLFYGPEPYIIELVGGQTVLGFRQYIEVLWSRGR
jgi:sugar-specific transcriptional regulator TrmB